MAGPAITRMVRPSRTAERGRTMACGLGLGVAGAALAAAPPHEILVVGTLPTARSALAKITTPLVDTPQSISIVGADEIQARGITTLTDALRGVPGISLGAGETSWQGNNFILRGFTTRNDTFLDGMRDYGYYYRDPFNDASVEVLKGPSSILFGRGATGGAINQASKQAQRAPLAEAELSLGTDGTRRGTIDLDAPLGATGAVRLNAMDHRSEVADRDGARDRRWGVAPTLALGLGTPTRLTLAYFHQSENNRPDYGIPWFDGAPAKVPRASYYGFPSDYLDTRVDIATAHLSHDLSPAVMLDAQLRYSNDRRDFRTSEAVIAAGVAPATPLGQIGVSRNVFSGFSHDRFWQGQLSATLHFATGGISHALVTGVEVGRERPAPTYIFHVGVIGTSLLDPPPQTFTETSHYVRLTAHTRANTLGLYAIDSITLGRNWQIVAGLRWDDFDAQYRSIGFSPAGAVIATTEVDRDDRRFSGRAALVYKPDALSSLYVSYANAFNPSGEGVESLVSSGRSVAQANLNAKPETSRIVEAGAKRLFLGSRLLVTAAVFRIVKASVRIPDPANSGFNTNGGRQRVQGVELEASGQITPAWTVHASYAYLDSATLATDNPGAAGSPRIGEQLPITPRHSAGVQTDYRLTDRLGIGGGVTYQASRLGQNTNASRLRAPAYTVYEVRARYRLDRLLVIQANVRNLTDKLYYDQLHPFHVVPGAGRSVLFSLIATGL